MPDGGFGVSTFGEDTFADISGAVIVPPDLDAGDYSAEDLLAMIVKDLIDESTLQLSENGYTAVRSFKVTKVNGNSWERLYKASKAPGIPGYNDAHPGVPKCFVDVIAVKPEGASTFKVIVSYKTPAPGKSQGGAAKTLPVIRGGSSVSQVTTSKGFAKDNPNATAPELLETSYQTLADSIAKLEPQKHVELVQKMVAIPVEEFIRKESFNPSKLNAEYSNRINKEKFRGWPPFTVMCTGIQYQSNDGGKTYETTYSFQYNRDGYEIDVCFVKENGKLLSDAEITAAKGLPGKIKPIRTFNVYEAIDFAPLKLEDSNFNPTKGAFTASGLENF